MNFIPNAAKSSTSRNEPDIENVLYLIENVEISEMGEMMANR